jgi:hypothetical protein
VSKGTITATDLLAKVLKNTSLPWDSITDLYVALHTADPGVGGDQTTSEVSHGAYARVQVVRSASGWSVAAGVGTNVAAVAFPWCTSGSATATHISIGTAASGAGQILWTQALVGPITVTTDQRFNFAAGAIQITEA